jgi:hypothetical protein
MEKNIRGIRGLGKLYDRYAAMKKYAQLVRRKDVVVGFAAPYAIYIHENREIWPPGMRLAGEPRSDGNGRYWDPQGVAQPKFLEEPAREHRKELAGLIKIVVRQTGNPIEGMLQAGKVLLTISQGLVPVDTGELKNSGYVKVIDR